MCTQNTHTHSHTSQELTINLKIYCCGLSCRAEPEREILLDIKRRRWALLLNIEPYIAGVGWWRMGWVFMCMCLAYRMCMLEGTQNALRGTTLSWRMDISFYFPSINANSYKYVKCLICVRVRFVHMLSRCAQYARYFIFCFVLLSLGVMRGEGGSG